METTTGPGAGMNADVLANHQLEVARLKAACQTRYGLKPVPGKYVSFFTPDQLAELLKISTKTLERWRPVGLGPAFKKTGSKRIRYSIADVETWLDVHGSDYGLFPLYSDSVENPSG